MTTTPKKIIIGTIFAVLPSICPAQSPVEVSYRHRPDVLNQYIQHHTGVKANYSALTSASLDAFLPGYKSLAPSIGLLTPRTATLIESQLQKEYTEQMDSVFTKKGRDASLELTDMEVDVVGTIYKPQIERYMSVYQELLLKMTQLGIDGLDTQTWVDNLEKTRYELSVMSHSKMPNSERAREYQAIKSEMASKTSELARYVSALRSIPQTISQSSAPPKRTRQHAVISSARANWVSAANSSAPGQATGLTSGFTKK